jgi:hypothetical protein
MKFRYYITDLMEGIVSGTDDPALVNDLRESDDFFIVDTETGLWLCPDSDDTVIQAYDS